MFFLRVYLAVRLIDWSAFAADTLGHATNYWRLNNTLVVVNASNAMIIGVADEDFDVAA